mmetsp:Transcript_125705/g.268215  ORF Transcript_125705/g.268215 Transcript_125705/m.268215 type:complete len:203 (-) Transcript_125705:90-698(-)
MSQEPQASSRPTSQRPDFHASGRPPRLAARTHGPPPPTVPCHPPHPPRSLGSSQARGYHPSSQRWSYHVAETRGASECILSRGCAPRSAAQRPWFRPQIDPEGCGPGTPTVRPWRKSSSSCSWSTVPWSAWRPVGWRTDSRLKWSPLRSSVATPLGVPSKPRGSADAPSPCARTHCHRCTGPRPGPAAACSATPRAGAALSA